MRQGAVFPAVYLSERPDTGGPEVLCVICEESDILVGVHPVLTDDLRLLDGVRHAVDIAFVEGVAAHRLRRVGHVDDAEVRFDAVFLDEDVLAPEVAVVGKRREFRVLEVIDELREALAYGLPDILQDDAVAFPGAGQAEYHITPEGVDDVQPAFPPPPVDHILYPEVDGVIGNDGFLGPLFERLVGALVRVPHRVYPLPYVRYRHRHQHKAHGGGQYIYRRIHLGEEEDGEREG